MEFRDQWISKPVTTFCGGGGGATQGVITHVGRGVVNQLVLVVSCSGVGRMGGADVGHQAVGEDTAVLRDRSKRKYEE